MIRPGSPSDSEFIRRLAARVFSHLGDYERIVPEWLAHEGVLSFVADEDDQSVGFTMIGFYRIEGPAPAFAADLIGIAVEPDAQRRGIGRRLLDHAIAASRSARRRLPVREMRLSVAAGNARARTMFAAAGFVEIPGDHGVYDGGQRALHLRRPL